MTDLARVFRNFNFDMMLQRAVTIGQQVSLYRNNICLGGGVAIGDGKNVTLS